jgi:hypothetical protein
LVDIYGFKIKEEKRRDYVSKEISKEVLKPIIANATSIEKTQFNETIFHTVVNPKKSKNSLFKKSKFE